MVDCGSILSSSNLLQFGYDPVSGGALEFLFGTPSGSLITDTVFPNKPIDILFRGLTFPGSWNTNWTSTNFAAMAEIKDPDPPEGVPEPATLLLTLTGVGAAMSILTGKSAFTSGLRQLAVGAIAAAITYAIGSALGVATT